MMSSPEYAVQIAEAQRLLDLNCPSPEEDLVRLCSAVARTPETKRYAAIRLLVAEVDDLISQTRWNLGQAMLILEIFPELEKAGDDDDPLFKNAGMLAAVALLLRGYVARAQQVVFTDLHESWRGGTAAGWIFHMMIDDAVNRSVSILDRLAKIVSLVCEMPFDRMYFRSRKLRRVHAKKNTAETLKLVEMSESEIHQFLLEYRDSLSHDKKAFARLAGFPIEETYVDENGMRVLVDNLEWTAGHLLGLGIAAYHQMVAALGIVACFCQQQVTDRRPGIPLDSGQ